MPVREADQSSIRGLRTLLRNRHRRNENSGHVGKNCRPRSAGVAPTILPFLAAHEKSRKPLWIHGLQMPPEGLEPSTL